MTPPMRRSALDLTGREIEQLMQGTPNAERFLQSLRSRVALHVNQRLDDRELLLLIGLRGEVLQLIWPKTRQRLEAAAGATLEALQLDPARRAEHLGLTAEQLADGEAKAKSGFVNVLNQRAREARLNLEQIDLEKQAAATEELRLLMHALPPLDLAILLYVRDDSRPLLSTAARARVAATCGLRHLDFLHAHEQVPAMLGMTRVEFRAAAGRLAAWWVKAIDEIATRLGANPFGDPNREH
jgi:hypothetical protein